MRCGIRINTQIEHGTRINTQIEHGIRINTQIEHGIRINTQIGHGIRIYSLSLRRGASIYTFWEMLILDLYK